jgi:hypothetical protein
LVYVQFYSPKRYFLAALYLSRPESPLSFSNSVVSNSHKSFFSIHSFLVSMLLINSATIFTLALAVTAKSAIAPRDEASITKVLTDVTALTANLDQIVKVFGGDPQPLTDASAKLLAGINDGIKIVLASEVLELLPSANIGTSTMDLNTTVAATVADLISKKQALIQAGQGPTVYKSLQEQKVAADNLSKAVLSRLEPQTREIGVTLSEGIIISLQGGIDAFKEAGTAPPPVVGTTVTASPTVAPVISAPAAPVNGTSSTKAPLHSTGAYDTPTSPSKTSSAAYDLPTSSSKPTKSAPGYGYDTPSASVKPTKSAPGYGYDTPSAPASKPTKPAPGYDSPPAENSPSGAPPSPSKSKTWAPVPSSTKPVPPAVFTAGATSKGMSGSLAVLAAAVMLL